MDEVKPLYPITFAVTYHDPPIPTAQVPEGHGACSTLLIGSYMESPDGKMDVGFSGLNENGDNLDPINLFRIWVTMASYLNEKLPEGSGPKELCSSVKQVIKRMKDMAEKNADDKSNN